MEIPAVEVAKSRDGSGKYKELTLANGTRVRIIPVAATLIDEVTSKIKDPPVPMWHNPDKDRDEPNPSDPNYLAALEEARKARGTAALDAMILFGIELLDGVPDDNAWIRKIEMLKTLGVVDLSRYDMNDPIVREFAYKKYIVATAEVIQAISEISGVSGAEIAEAEASFRGN